MTEYIALSGRLTVILHYDVGGLYVRQDLLGTTLEAERGGLRVCVEFPRVDNRFEGHVPSPEAGLIRGWHGEKEDPMAVYVVDLIRVQVDMRRGLGDEGSGNAERALIEEARPIGTSAVRRLLDWARTFDRQPWLIPPHMRPPVVGPAYLVNEAGEMTHGYRDTGSVIVVHDPKDLPTGDLRAGLSGEKIPEAKSLLAEARWAVWPTVDPDTKRAVLLAAIALEVKTPEVLLSVADNTSRNLLECLYARFDETPMSVNFQLNEIAEIVLGEALKSSRGQLAKRVRDLYKLRGKVAHAGRTPDLREALRAVDTAEQVFAWLESHLTQNRSRPVGPDGRSDVG